MQVVKFKNGTYGVRRWSIFGFQFISASGNWWTKRRSVDFRLEHSEEEAKRLYLKITDNGEPLN